MLTLLVLMDLGWCVPWSPLFPQQTAVHMIEMLAEFDRILRDAEGFLRKRDTKPVKRTSLTAAEIERMTDAFHAKLLAEDERWRFGGRAAIAEGVAWMRRNDDPDFELPYPLESVPEFGWSPEQLAREKEGLIDALEARREALALGDIAPKPERPWPEVDTRM